MGEALEKLIIREGDVLAVVSPHIAFPLHEGVRLLTTGDPMSKGVEVKERPYEGKFMVADSPDIESLIPVSTDELGKPTDKFPNVLASEIIFGYFGEIGYVDIVQQKGSPRLIGLVHIPKQLVYMIGAMKSDVGLEQFYKEFCVETEGNRWKKYRWNLQGHQTEISPEFKDLPIGEGQFYWKIEKLESDIFKDKRPLPQQLAEYITAIRNFIIRLDNHVYRLMPGTPPEDVITPELARTRFESIQQSGSVKYLHP